MESPQREGNGKKEEFTSDSVTKCGKEIRIYYSLLEWLQSNRSESNEDTDFIGTWTDKKSSNVMGTELWRMWDVGKGDKCKLNGVLWFYL